MASVSKSISVPSVVLTDIMCFTSRHADTADRQNGRTDGQMDRHTEGIAVLTQCVVLLCILFSIFVRVCFLNKGTIILRNTQITELGNVSIGEMALKTTLGHPQGVH